MSNLGWTEFDILNANVLYVNGQPFTNYISNLIAEDSLEQGEIDEIKAFLQRLDLQITAPNTLTITNENRNSVLLTRLDGNDTSIGALNTKTQYQSSVQGNDGTLTNSTFQVNINDRIKRQLSLSTGANSISSINNSSTMGSTGNYNQNRILLQA